MSLLFTKKGLETIYPGVYSESVEKLFSRHLSLVISTLVVIIFVLLLGVIVNFHKPINRLHRILQHRIDRYHSNYDVSFRPSEGLQENKVLEVFSLDGRLKVVRKIFLPGGSIDSNFTQTYLDDFKGSYLCATPVFIDTNGKSFPMSSLSCNEQRITKDPFSTDENVMPQIRLDLVTQVLTNKNLRYLEQREIMNKPCAAFRADLRGLDSSLSENVKYQREVYNTEPQVAELDFCLDEATAVPLEMTVVFASGHNGDQTTLSYLATRFNLDVNNRDFLLPTGN